jgi:rare lipoprotein A (peptidoglycan hydrolase)
MNTLASVRCRPRFLLAAGAAMLALASCSTINDPSERDSGSPAPDSPVTAPAVEGPEPFPQVAPSQRPRQRVHARRARPPVAQQAAVPDAQAAQGAMGQPDPDLEALIEGAAAGQLQDSQPVAGPTPMAEPLASYANRPYRLRGRKYRPMTELTEYTQRGIASWYGRPFHGRKTAIGERYDMHSMSAAHPTLPLPSYVKVTNLKNGTSVIVRVNDRGPFAHGRIIDLSHAAARHLGMVKGGLAAVEINLIVPEPAGTETPAPLADVGK